jgi:hypothetical protein
VSPLRIRAPRQIVRILKSCIVDATLFVAMSLTELRASKSGRVSEEDLKYTPVARRSGSKAAPIAINVSSQKQHRTAPVTHIILTSERYHSSAKFIHFIATTPLGNGQNVGRMAPKCAIYERPIDHSGHGTDHSVSP